MQLFFDTSVVHEHATPQGSTPQRCVVYWLAICSIIAVICFRLPIGSIAGKQCCVHVAPQAACSSAYTSGMVDVEYFSPRRVVTECWLDVSMWHILTGSCALGW